MLRSKPSNQNAFLKQIEDFGILRWRRRGEPTYVPCDEIAMTCAIDPNSILEQEGYYSTVECHGHQTRGQMIVDYRTKSNKVANVSIVTEINVEFYLRCLQSAVNHVPR